MISNIRMSYYPNFFPAKNSSLLFANQKVCPIKVSHVSKTMQVSIRAVSSAIPNHANAQDMISISREIASNAWTNYFLNVIPEDEEMIAQRKEQVKELKEEVKVEVLASMDDKTMCEQLELINILQLIGVAYHFEDEIEGALVQIYEAYLGDDIDYNQLNLYHASLLFRLLRQNGFYVSCVMFKKFLDKNKKFESCLSGDVEGMLSLYEASHLRTHGDDILDQAITFATTQLKLMANKLPHRLADIVTHALDFPHHKSVPLIESRYYISLYEDNPSCNKTLLKFAKLNFNMVQSILKKEISHLTRWCFDQGMDLYSALPCKVRDQIASLYYAAIGTVGEHPEHGVGRIAYFKLCIVGGVLDDLYEECDIKDLQLLTKAIQRWDKNCVNILPENLRIIYTKLLDTIEEVKQELGEGRAHVFHHVVETFKIIWPPHMQVRKWRYEKYFPTFDEYMNTKATTGYECVTILTWLGIERTSADNVSEWLKLYSNAIEALGAFYRLMDDIAEDYLNVAEEVSVVPCYMKQYNITDKAEAHKQLQKLLDNVWKDFNYSSLRPSTAPTSVLQRIVSQARMLYVGFYGGDGFTYHDRTHMKKIYALLYRDPITT